MQEFFGIDVGGTAVKWAVLGEDFSIRDRGSLPTGFTTAEETVSALIGLVEPYRMRVSAVGVSAPGGIYEGDVTGTIHRGGALTFMDGCPLGKLMREALGVPVAVNNDGKCCALGEYVAGALLCRRVQLHAQRCHDCREHGKLLCRFGRLACAPRCCRCREGPA